MEPGEEKNNEGITEERKKPGFFDRLYARRRWFEVLAIVLIVCIGLFVRLEDFDDWKKRPSEAFYQNEPLLTTFDGYHYLRLSRDLQTGNYDSIDPQRDVPQGIKRPSPPPLLSMIAAGIAKISPYSLNWIAAMLPAFIGVLLFVPLYALGRFYGGSAMGLTAALVGLVTPFYAYKSGLGWFDTDMMNVTWVMVLTWCALWFGHEKTVRRYWYFALGLIASILFYWWWDSAPYVVVTLCSLIFLVPLVFFYRPARREGFIFGGVIAAGLVGVLFVKGFALPVEIVSDIFSKFQHFARGRPGDFPNVAVTISDAAQPGFSEIADRAIGSIIVFVLSGFGFVLLCWRRGKYALFMGVPLALGALSFLFALRFVIFLAPVVALGLGFLVHEIWSWRKKFWPLAAVAAVLAVAVALPAFAKDVTRTFWPKESTAAVHGMVLAGRLTPPESLIWAWWDHGYNLQYWSGRGTITDGGKQDGERCVYNGLPMATGNERLAANFIQFYANRGKSGIREFYAAVGGDPEKGFPLIKKILGKGPDEAERILSGLALQPAAGRRTAEDWLEFFYPENPRPAYLFLDFRLVKVIGAWFWMGTWDLAEQDGKQPNLRFYNGLGNDEKKIYGDEITVWSENGRVQLKQQGQTFNLDTLTVHYANDTRDSEDYNPEEQEKPTDFYFDYHQKQDLGILHDKKVAESVFGRLFVRELEPEKYFSPLAEASVAFQIWKVEADSLE